MTSPLLSIVIPTFNRASYLEMTLRHLHSQIGQIAPGLVEVLVSDNASPDNTAEVVASSRLGGLEIRSVRNEENIGSDANIAQSFNLAAGRHVLILGDDDIPLPGAIDWLLRNIENADYGVIYLRPYGYSADIEAEFPGGEGRETRFTDPGRFLTAIGPYITLISACVINKGLLGEVDARQYCGGNLVQVHLVLQAALLAKVNLHSSRYRIACKRDNSGGYDRAVVFVRELGKILDQYRYLGLSDGAIHRFERRMILGFHPTYLLRQRQFGNSDLNATYEIFARRYFSHWLFWPWLVPILKLPRHPAIFWGYVTSAIGRVLTGDFRRGLAFLGNVLFRGRQR